jgi:hypothetical protein
LANKTKHFVKSALFEASASFSLPMGSRKHPSVYLHQAAVSLSLSSALTTVYIIRYYSSFYPLCAFYQESADDMGSQWTDDETNHLLDFVKAKHEAKVMVLVPHFVTHKISDFRGAQTVVRSRTDEQCCARWERVCISPYFFRSISLVITFSYVAHISLSRNGHNTLVQDGMQN